MLFKNDNGASLQTGNITGILSEGDAAYIRKLMPLEMEITFGPGNEDCYIPSKGYEDPEWYWRTESGGVVGIGWRHGRARLRGARITTEEAAAFVQFLRASEDLIHGS